MLLEKEDSIFSIRFQINCELDTEFLGQFHLKFSLCGKDKELIIKWLSLKGIIISSVCQPVCTTVRIVHGADLLMADKIRHGIQMSSCYHLIRFNKTLKMSAWCT